MLRVFKAADLSRSERKDPTLLDCSAAVKTCGRQIQWQKALWLAARLFERNVAGDVILHNSLIAVCQKAAQWHKSLQLLVELPSNSLQHTVISYNATISACWWQVAVMLAHRKDFQRDTITFNSALSSLDRAVGQWQLAFHLFTNLRCDTLQPTVISSSTAMSVVGVVGQSWDVALQFLTSDRWKVQADVVMYSVAINACGKCQERNQDFRMSSQRNP